MTTEEYNLARNQALALLEEIKSCNSGKLTGIRNVVYWSTGQVSIVAKVFQEIIQLKKGSTPHDCKKSI